MASAIIPITPVIRAIGLSGQRFTTGCLVVASTIPKIASVVIAICFRCKFLASRCCATTSVVIPITARCGFTGRLVCYAFTAQRIAMATAIIPVIAVSFAIALIVRLCATRLVSMTSGIPPVAAVSFAPILPPRCIS